MEHERGGEQLLLFLWKYSDFTCSLYIINYAEIQKFPFFGWGGSIHPFVSPLGPWLAASECEWVGGNSVCVCVNKKQMNEIPVLNLLLSHCGISYHRNYIVMDYIQFVRKILYSDN